MQKLQFGEKNYPGRGIRKEIFFSTFTHLNTRFLCIKRLAGTPFISYFRRHI